MPHRVAAAASSKPPTAPTAIHAPRINGLPFLAALRMHRMGNPIKPGDRPAHRAACLLSGVAGGQSKSKPNRAWTVGTKP